MKPTTTSAGLAAKESVLVLKGNEFVKYTGTEFKPNKAQFLVGSEPRINDDATSDDMESKEIEPFDFGSIGW